MQANNEIYSTSQPAAGSLPSKAYREGNALSCARPVPLYWPNFRWTTVRDRGFQLWPNQLEIDYSQELPTPIGSPLKICEGEPIHDLFTS